MNKIAEAQEIVVDKKKGFTINHELDKYDNVVLFPERLQRANEMIAKHGIPKPWAEERLLRKQQKAFWTKGILAQADADTNTFVLVSTDEKSLIQTQYPVTVASAETLTKLVKSYWNGMAQVHIKPKTLDENETEYDLIDVNWRTW